MKYLIPLFNNASVGIALANDEGHFVKVNQKYCNLIGYTNDELLSLQFKDITHPEDAEKDLNLFTYLLSGQIDSYKIEKRYIRKDGSIFWGLMTVSIARQDDGTSIAMGILQDIDADKKAERALLKSKEHLFQHNAYKDRLFSTIAHDLRGPVLNAVSLLEVIEKNSASLSKEKVVDLISKLRLSMYKTSGLLENLLTWSQAQFREIKYEPSSLILTDQIAKVTEQLQSQAELKNILVEIDVPADIRVVADKQMLHIILRNLISNAIKYSHVGKTVKVEAVAKDSFIHVSVLDEGVGLSERDKAMLLGRNMEGLTTYGTSGEKGTGLGLNLCMSYLERHGGSLYIKSEEGKGSKFTFTVPAAIA